MPRFTWEYLYTVEMRLKPGECCNVPREAVVAMAASGEDDPRRYVSPDTLRAFLLSRYGPDSEYPMQEKPNGEFVLCRKEPPRKVEIEFKYSPEEFFDDPIPRN